MFCMVFCLYWSYKADGLCSSVVINLNEVERIEIIYEKDSKVWKKANWKKCEDF